MIRLQQATQTLDANGLCLGINPMRTLDHSTQRLVNLFMMVVFSALLKNLLELLHRRQNQMIQALRFDRSDKAFGIAIQIRTSCRKYHGLHR